MSTTKKHIAEKADMLESHEYQAAMKEMRDKEDSKHLINKVASCMLHFDLHRHSEHLQIEMKDVALDASDDGDANFPHLSKRHAEGFSHKTHGYAKPTFRKRMAQLSQKADKNLCFEEHEQ